MKQRHWLEQRALLTPTLPALITDEETLTFADLQHRALDTALCLKALGVEPGARIAVLLPNGSFFVELLYATLYCGAVFVPLNTRLTAAEIRHQLDDVEARLLIHSKHFTSLAQDIATKTQLCAADRNGDLPHQHEKESTQEPANTDSLRSELDFDDLLAILYTSGTSGVAKGVQLSVGNFFWSAVGSALHLGSLPGERTLACLPLYHVGGLALLIRSVLFGGSLVLHERFDATKVCHALEHENIALVSLVPTMLKRVLDATAAPLRASALRGILLGGAAAPPDLLERARQMQLPVLPTYGLTEACSQVATRPVASATAPQTSGVKPLLTTRICIVRSDGRHSETHHPSAHGAAANHHAAPATNHPTPIRVDSALPFDLCATGELGEIYLQGPSITRGYLHEKESPFANGWFKTGDLGHLDCDGNLHVLDRRADLIVSGGENVSPREVEDVLLAHPAVQDAGVAALPDPDLGQTVAAWIVLREGTNASDAELKSFCRTRLAGYKIPRRLQRCRELPRNASGKLLRRELSSIIF